MKKRFRHVVLFAGLLLLLSACGIGSDPGRGYLLYQKQPFRMEAEITAGDSFRGRGILESSEDGTQIRICLSEPEALCGFTYLLPTGDDAPSFSLSPPDGQPVPLPILNRWGGILAAGRMLSLRESEMLNASLSGDGSRCDVTFLLPDGIRVTVTLDGETEFPLKIEAEGDGVSVTLRVLSFTPAGEGGLTNLALYGTVSNTDETESQNDTIPNR